MGFMSCFVLILFLCFLSFLVSAEHCKYLIYWSIKFWESLCHIRTNSVFVLFLCVSHAFPLLLFLVCGFLTVLDLSVHLPSIFTLCTFKVGSDCDHILRFTVLPQLCPVHCQAHQIHCSFLSQVFAHSPHIFVIISLLIMSIHFCVV